MHVSALYIYPVKGCGGIAASRFEIGKYGFMGDRQFLIVDPSGKFMTQREHPQLALIETMLNKDSLVLAKKGLGSVALSLEASSFHPVVQRVTIWRNEVQAEDCGDEVSRWLTQVVGETCRLVTIGSTYSRPVRPERAQPGDEVSFADAYPFLVLSEASVADLNGRLDTPLPMNRYRPNIVVTQAQAFAEDTWPKIRIGGVTFRAGGPCARCPVTTTDQETGERGKEPLRTLASYRRTADNNVNFGQNFIQESKSGFISVGDAIEVIG